MQPDLFDVARKQYVQRRLLTRRAVLATRKAWQRIDPGQIRLSWMYTVGPAIIAITAAAQLEAASTANTDVRATLAAQGIPSDPMGLVVPSALAGIASNGRNLAQLLELSNVFTLRQIAAGRTTAQALAIGGRWLQTAVGTQVSDAGRAARSIARAAEPHVDGFYRVLNTPSCSRCVLVAGKWYRWDAAFDRHPKCDCSQIEARDGSLEGNPKLWTPMRYFDSLSKPEQDAVFGKAGAEAIRSGANISQVVNARSGMFTVGGRSLAHAGASLYGRNGVRPMPEQLFKDAHGDRAEAIRLLTEFGYISPSSPRTPRPRRSRATRDFTAQLQDIIHAAQNAA